MSSGALAPLNILSIEHNADDFRQIERYLNHAAPVASLHRVDTRAALDTALRAGRWDLVITEINVPGLDLDDAYGVIRAQHPELPVIVVSGTGDAKTLGLHHRGIADVIHKDHLPRLATAIERAIADADQRRDQARADAALRASEARLSQILQAAHEGIWTIDLNERTTLVNPAMAAMLGYTEAEMIGRPLRDFVDAGGLSVARRALSHLPMVAPGPLEGSLRHKDGRPIWVRANCSGLTDADGRVTGALALVSDVSTQRAAEAEMRLQSAALNASDDAVVIADRTGAILWVNPAFERLTGYTAAEALGKNPRELQRSGLHDAAFYRDMWDAVLAGRVWRGEMTNRRRDGTLYHEDMTITPLVNDAGAVDSFVAIKRDLTGKKALEAQLLQAQKMESVGRLAGGIAHDFNNLLTVINGVSELGLDSLPEGDPLRNDLEEIHHAGVRAAGLTRQLLAFSRKQIVKAEVLDLNTLITGTQSMLRRMVGEDVRFVICPAAGVLKVKADIGQLEQVLMNLVVNARDAMAGGGTLTVATRGVRLARELMVYGGTIPPGPYVVLDVTDTGLGMDAQTQARVFDPFFTTKEIGKGSGLGLSTVYGIVEQWRGGVTLSSTLGQGTTFSVYLPCQDQECHAVAAPGDLAGGSETILIVEDEELVRVTTQRMIRAAGYDVLAVANASEAMLVLEHHDQPIDLLLTDVVMPGMAGPDLVAHASQGRPDLAVLYMSGHTDNPALLRSVSSAEQRLITKPFSAVELMHALRSALAETAAARRVVTPADGDAMRGRWRCTPSGRQ